MNNENFSEPTVQPTEVKRKTNWLALVIVFVVTALIFAGGVYTIQKVSFDTQKKAMNDSFIAALLQAQQPVKKSNVYSELDVNALVEVYRNHNYGFEIQLPYNYTIEESGIKEISFASQETRDAVYKNNVACSDNNSETQCAPEILNLDLVFNGNFSGTSNKINPGKETINSIVWDTFTEPGLYGFKFYETKKDGKEYSFSSVKEEELKKVLATFNFTETDDGLPYSYIQGGDVYYVENRLKFLIARSSTREEEGPSLYKVYEKAIISPNGKFILLSSQGWESRPIEVYEIATKKIYLSNELGDDVSWTPESKLLLEASCDMGISCGIYESSDIQKPWVLKKISEFK